MRPAHFVARILLTVGIFGVSATRSPAQEWQLKPFVGATYGGSTTYSIVGLFPPKAHLVLGGSGMWLGEIFGVEGDYGHTSGFFQDSNNASLTQLVTDSGVTTLTGNVVVAVPRHLVQYTLRPYLVGGAGMTWVSINYSGNPLPTSSTLKTMDLGAGVTGFLTKRLGVSWDVRYFRSIDRTIESGTSIGSEHLSFWRATMAVAIRL